MPLTNCSALALDISWRASVAPSVKNPLPNSLAPCLYQAPATAVGLILPAFILRNKLNGVIASSIELNAPDARAGIKEPCISGSYTAW